jgi:hypothetical protein
MHTRNEDRSPTITNGWIVDSERDAIMQLNVRRVEAEMLCRADYRYEAREDGINIGYLDAEPLDEQVVVALIGMGYKEEEMLAVMQ